MNKKLKLNFLLLIVKLGFKKYPVLYFVSIFSVFSVFIEIVAMSLISSISSDKYILFGDILSSIDKKMMFFIVVLLFIIRFVSLFFIENYQVLIARKFQSFLSVAALEEIYNSPLSTIEKKTIGFFISLAGDESSRASEILNAILRLLNFIILFILYLFVIIYFDLKVALLIVALFIISFSVVKSIIKKSSELGNVSSLSGRDARSIFLDGLNGLKTVKSLGIESFICKKYEVVLNEYLMINYKLFLLTLLNRLVPVIIFFILFDIYIILDYSGENTLNATYLIALFFILMRFLLNLGELMQTVNKIVGDLKVAGDIISFIQKPKNLNNEVREIAKINSIVFENISFGYKKSKNIFNNLQLEFTSKNSYAIVGQTGSGKSTLIDLMMDFLIPQKGRVLINLIDSRQLDIKSLKEKVIYISQESIVFNDTIKNNILLDKIYSDDKIKEALALVELTSLIDSFEMGLDYLLHYKGTNISGGQKQRLNIARAIIREPDVLILDESVNALDGKTRVRIVKNLLGLFKDKIIIFVTHDNEILEMMSTVIDLDIKV